MVNTQQAQVVKSLLIWSISDTS